MTNDAARAAYDELPEAVRATLSFTEYLWLSDADKLRLLQTCTEPETYDD